MTRIKKGVAANKHRKYVLKRAKGYQNAASKKFRAAKEHLIRAEKNMYKSRRLLKRDMRSLWITRINGGLMSINSELNYSRFIHLMALSGSTMNRKMIAEIAATDIEEFKVLVASVQK